MTHAIKDMVSQLSPREQFKFAFLEKCAEMGFSADEMLVHAEEALQRTKQAQGSTVADYIENAAKGLLGGGLAYGAHRTMGATLPFMAIGIPTVGGALIGRQLAKMQEPSEYDIEAIKHREKLDEYKKQIDRLTREKRIRDYREQDTGKGGRPLL